MTALAAFLAGLGVGILTAGAIALAAKDRLNTALGNLETAAASVTSDLTAARTAAASASAPVGDTGGMTEDETNAAAARVEAAVTVLQGAPAPVTPGVISDPAV